MVRKELIAVLMIASMFLISACDVYNTLYIKQPGIRGEVVEVPEVNITLEVPEETIMEEKDGTEEIMVEGIGTDEELIVEEKTETSNVILVGETEKVSLVAKAEDPDNDNLIFAFTSPLDSNGEWQTTYGDAGEYTITVTVSDGTLTTSKEVLIIIKKKEEAPVLNSFSPRETSVIVDETSTIGFEISASDSNNDKLDYEWKLDGARISDKSSYVYRTTYEDAGSHTVKAIVKDGLFETERIWAVTVNNKNRKPVLQSVNNIESKETDKITIELIAEDLDGGSIAYKVDDQRFAQDGNVFIWETTYDDAGEYTFTVSASDGVDTASQQVNVKVENVNRPPVILDIVQK